MLSTTDDLRIRGIRDRSPSVQVIRAHPRTEAGACTVLEALGASSAILESRDDRLAVIVRPCSIQDPVAALDNARRLAALRHCLSSQLEIPMLVHFEKPRTTVVWKELINDPHLHNSFAVNEGFRIPRRLLLEIANLGPPAACEFLDMATPQSIADLVAWAAIGVRTT